MQQPLVFVEIVSTDPSFLHILASAHYIVHAREHDSRLTVSSILRRCVPAYALEDSCQLPTVAACAHRTGYTVLLGDVVEVKMVLDIH